MMTKTTMLAVPLTRCDPPLEVQLDTALAAGAELVELRVDQIGDADAVARLLETRPTGRFVLTVRGRDEGGAWDGDDAERIALIERLGLLTPGYVDVELATWRRSANLRQKVGLVCRRTDHPADADERRKNKLILSMHDFSGIPDDLEARFAELAETPAAVVKIAVAAGDACDALRVLDLLHRHAAAHPVIALGMGEGGLLTRVLARKFGAFLSFAALQAGGESAPGQPTIEDMRNLYGWDRIAPPTRVFGVIGWPVSHSRSPHVHNAAMQAAGIDGVYVPAPVRPTYEAFAAFMDGVEARPWLDASGFSVTIPHKEHALLWLEQRGGEISPLTRGCGAVNTLVRTPHGWRGENTDGAAALAALSDALGWSGDARPEGLVEVLGAGGAARAVAAALRECGAAVVVTNRTPERAERLAAELGCGVRPWEQRAAADVDAIIQCTRVGMTPDAAESPVPAERLRPDLIVLDTVYTPRQTRLLREARERGATTIDGGEMFLRQAAAQFRLWHGRDPDAAVMRAALGPD